MLDLIPIEILELIVKNIHAQSDLQSLCEVSKHVSKVATPQLYESITLRTGDMIFLGQLNYKLELVPRENSKYTRSICIKAPLNYNLRERCPHYNLDMSDRLDDPFAEFGLMFKDLISTLKDDNLQSLSLDLGCCIPVEVLGDDVDFCFKDQKCIQSISLITDGGCPTFGHNVYLNLRPLTNLQSLSWKGLIRGDHFDSLAGFIKNQEGEGARKLRTLILDLVEWSRADKAWYKHQQETLAGHIPRLDNFFATSILGIEPEQENILFTALETLRLTGVAFSPFNKEFSHCFNIVNLSRLQLSNCPTSLELLETLLGDGITLKLKSFELAIDWEYLHHYWDFDETQILVIYRFLDSFKGLKDLFLLLTTPSNGILYIANHQSTLKRLILHERDKRDGKIVDGSVPWHNSGEVLFYDSNLTCFGTSGPISKMESSLAELPKKPRCKIMHVRVSWIDYHKERELREEENYYKEREQAYNYQYYHSDSDFEDPIMFDVMAEQRIPLLPIAADVDGGPFKDFFKFARWAFGPEGIPELRILAWGDFSHNGRWDESNVILCRDQSMSTGSNFRALRDSDFEYCDLFDENMDMLSACSPDHLLWKQL